MESHVFRGLVLILLGVLLNASIAMAGQQQGPNTLPEATGTTGEAISRITPNVEMFAKETPHLLELDGIDVIKRGLMEGDDQQVDISEILPHPTPVPTPTVLQAAASTTFILAVWIKLIADKLQGK